MSNTTSQQWQEIRRVTFWGLAANLALSGMKFVFGIAGASQALVADAVHSLSDSLTDIVLLVAAPFWTAPADATHPHGHGRIETAVTLLIGVLLGIVGLGLGYRAVLTLHEQQAASPGWIAFVAACLSMVSKEGLYRWHVSVGRRIKSSALVANAWHHRSDSLSSLPVAVAVLGTRIWPTWGSLDYIAAVIVSVFILHAAWKIVRPALSQLIDAGATLKEQDRILSIASSVQGVQAVHALRTRYVGPGLHVDLHVLVHPKLTVRAGHAIAGAVKQYLLKQGPEIIDVLVHIEPYEEAADTSVSGQSHAVQAENSLSITQELGESPS